MQFVRFSVMALICVCLSGIAWADKDDKTDNVSVGAQTGPVIGA